MKPQAELEKWIQDSAQYIRRKRKQDREFGRAAEDYKIIKAKLDRAERHLLAMFDELHSIQIQMTKGRRWRGFADVERYIRKTLDTAGPALGPLSDAKVVIRRDPATRAMQEQHTAIRLAHAATEAGKPSRATREVARRIMDAAGIEHPSNEAITKWLREIRAEDAASRAKW